MGKRPLSQSHINNSKNSQYFNTPHTQVSHDGSVMAYKTYLYHIILPGFDNGSSWLFLLTPGIQIPHHPDNSDWEMPRTVWRSPNCGHQLRHQQHPCDGLPGKQDLLDFFNKLIWNMFRRGVTPASPLGPHIMELLRYPIKWSRIEFSCIRNSERFDFLQRVPSVQIFLRQTSNVFVHLRLWW